MATTNQDAQDAQRPQPRKKRRKRKKKRLRDELSESLIFLVKPIEEYCKGRVVWETEVCPIINMLEAFNGRDGPPEVLAMIERVKKHFDDKKYGAKIIYQGDTIQGDKNEFSQGAKMEKHYLEKLIDPDVFKKQITNNYQHGKKRQCKR